MTFNIKNQTYVDRFTNLDSSVLSRIEKDAEFDARKNYPSSDAEEFSKIERDIINEANDLSLKYSSEVEKIRQQKNDEKEKCVKILKEDYPAKKRDLELNHQNRVETLASKLGSYSPKIERLNEELSDNKVSLNSLRNYVNGRELQTHFYNVYFLFMVALSLAEVWINRLAFELFFESNPLISLFLAAAVGAVLVFFSHITGHVVRQIHHTNKVTASISLIALTSLSLVFIFYLAKMRQAFVSITTLSTENITLENLIPNDLTELDNIIDTSVDISQNLFSTNIGEEGFFLLLVNIVVYVCGFIASYFRHDPHPDYEKLIKKNERINRKLLSLKSKHSHLLEELEKQYTNSLSKLNNEMNNIETNKDDLLNDLRQLDRLQKDSEKEITNALKTKIKTYRTKNKETRETPAPSYFRRSVTLESINNGA